MYNIELKYFVSSILYNILKIIMLSMFNELYKGEWMMSDLDTFFEIINNPIISSTFSHVHNINNDKDKFCESTPEVLRHLVDREILISVLDSLTSGVQIVDADGEILYVNSSFLSIVGVRKEDRIGKNVYEVSEDGSIANALKNGKPVINLKNYPKGSTVELVSSAAPIHFNEKIIGAVAVVNDVKDVIILSKKLKESNTLVKKLSEKISYYANAKYDLNDVIGTCKLMEKVKELIKLAAVNEITVLVLGETGTGKELIAEAIHSSGLRSKSPFVSINCSAIPENLLESEFFGYEKGAFTGAIRTKIGKFELANGGTLFLDEIGDMDLKLQTKILKAIEEKQIQRIGGESVIPLDIRIITATNRNLKSMVEEKLFRQDLYYRLNVLAINLPPLRDRNEDIPELCEFIINKLCRKIGRRGITISNGALEIMKRYKWPGNVRELENTLERIIISCDNSSEIDSNDVKSVLNVTDKIEMDSENGIKYINCEILEIEQNLNLKQIERETIEKALAKYGYSYFGKNEAAAALGISLATLYNKIKEYRLIENSFDI